MTGLHTAPPASWPTLRLLSLSAACLVALASGCASVAPPTAGQLFSGRLAVSVTGQPERSFSAGFDLSGSARQGELLLTGPLGTTAARAHWAPGLAELSTNQGSTRHASLDALVEQALGQAIPMAALFDWLQGRPWPEAPAAALAEGQPGFEQLGWRVSLSRLNEGWLEATRDAPPSVQVRIRLTTLN